MATVTEKRMIYLISETIKPTIDSVKLFKESMRTIPMTYNYTQLIVTICIL